MDAAPLEASVIVCAYDLGRWDLLVESVTSVESQSRPAGKIIVVIDHNPELLVRARERFAAASVVPNQGPRGLSGARNTGLMAARGDLVVYLDDDARAEPDWLAHLADAFTDSSVAAAGGTALPVWSGGRRPPWFPPAFDWVVGCTYQGYRPTAGRVRNVLGCNMAFRREALAGIDGFRTTLGRMGDRPFGVEETDACIRLRQRWPDRTIVHAPSAVVRHSVAAHRETWSYFLRRCYAEGISKAILARSVGSSQALESERRYTRSILPRAAVGAAVDAVRLRQPELVLRSMAVILGFAATASGFGWGAMTRRSAVSTPAVSSSS